MLEVPDLKALEALKNRSRYQAKLASKLVPLADVFEYLQGAQRILIDFEITDEDLSALALQGIRNHSQTDFELLNVACSVESKVLLELSSPNLKAIHFKTNLNNALNELSANEFGQQLKQLTHLQKLHIDLSNWNQLGSTGFTAICAALQTQTQLIEFGMRLVSHNIGPLGARQLSDALMAMQQLTSLDLFIGQGNFILCEGAIALASCLPYLKHLTNLSLLIGHQNRIEDKGILELTSSFSLIPKLKELRLLLWCHDNMGPMGGVGTMKNIASLRQLEAYEAFLKYNKNTHLIFQELPQYVRLVNIKRYKVTFWSGTAEGPLGAAAFGQSLKCLPTIQEVSISFHEVRFGTTGAIEIANGLKYLKHLRSLKINFRSNGIGTAGLESLRSTIEESSQLEELFVDLGPNLIDKMAIFNFCETIGLNKRIQKYSVNIADAQFDANVLIQEVRGLYEECEKEIDEELDAKTAYFCEAIGAELGVTIAQPKG